jgi:hypothetical protein
MILFRHIHRQILDAVQSICARVVVLVVVIALGMGVAHADKGRSVLVVTTGQKNAASTELTWRVRQEVFARQGLYSRDLTGLLDGKPNQSLSAARRALRRGRSAVDEFELPRAVTALVLASSVLSGWTHEADAASEALALLGQTYATMGELRKRDQVWRRLLRIKPDFRLKRDDVAPSVRRSLASVRKEIRHSGTGTIRVVSAKKGVPCAIFVDGIFRGLTPLKLSSILLGLHHLRLSADGYQHQYQILNLKKRRTKSVTCRLNPVARKILYDRIAAHLPKDLRTPSFVGFINELKALAASDQAILVAITGGEIQGALFDLVRRKVANQIRFPYEGQDLRGAANTLVERLYQDLDTRTPSTPLAASFLYEGTPELTSRTQDWLLWTGVAMGVAAAVIIPWMLWPDKEPGLTKVPNTGAVIVRF